MLEFDRTDVPKSSADINEAVDFSFVPVNCQCPHCKINVVTFIDSESGWQSYLGCCVSLFFKKMIFKKRNYYFLRIIKTSVLYFIGTFITLSFSNWIIIYNSFSARFFCVVFGLCASLRLFFQFYVTLFTAAQTA